jgi:hypothetical protein
VGHQSDGGDNPDCRQQRPNLPNPSLDLIGVAHDMKGMNGIIYGRRGDTPESGTPEKGQRQISFGLAVTHATASSSKNRSTREEKMTPTKLNWRYVEETRDGNRR